MVGVCAVPLIQKKSLSAGDKIVSGLPNALVVDLSIIIHILGVFVGHNVFFELQSYRIGTISIHKSSIDVLVSLLCFRDVVKS